MNNGTGIGGTFCSASEWAALPERPVRQFSPGESGYVVDFCLTSASSLTLCLGAMPLFVLQGVAQVLIPCYGIWIAIN